MRSTLFRVAGPEASPGAAPSVHGGHDKEGFPGLVAIM